MEDEKVLFLSDIFPTGYMAAENCGIEPGDTVAVWGCGPVGQFAIKQRVDAGRRPGDRHRPGARSG
jgi:threonine dehydrogenase-like Zn-dependent dehydrogenase